MRRPGAEKYQERKGYRMYFFDTAYAQRILRPPDPLFLRGDGWKSDVPLSGIKQTFDVNVRFEHVLPSPFDFADGGSERGKGEGV